MQRFFCWISFPSRCLRIYSMMSEQTDTDLACSQFNQPTRRMTRDALSKVERDRFLSMTKTKKRQLYKCGKDYVTLADVKTWSEFYRENIEGTKSAKLSDPSKSRHERYEVNDELNGKLSLWQGDITKLEVDAIVNAANNSLLGGGGVDGAIHSGAGKLLKQECVTLGGCITGDAKITGGYNLPAKYVIHTVGPIGEQESPLRNCYIKCLDLLAQHKLTSLAFPCISTGIYGYPNEKAACVALETIRNYLQHDAYSKKVQRIVLCVFLPVDLKIYKSLLPTFFPTHS